MERLEEAAREWLSSHGEEHKSSSVKRNNLDLKFNVGDPSISFTVTCPETEDESLTVWSDDSRLQSHLDVILEFCESKKTIAEILDKMNSILLKVLSKQEEAESDDDCDDDDFDYDDDYYNNPDDVQIDSKSQAASAAAERSDSDDEDDERFFGGKAAPAAFQRLIKDLKNMKKEAHKFGIEGSPRGDNIFIWDVKLTGFPTDTVLGKDIKNWADKHKREPVVYLEMEFPNDYPMAPPFVRVKRPRFKFLTGHVTIGGSICMEMLTRSGWTPSNDIEGILVQIRSEIMSDPNTRLDSNPDREYGMAEARDAFDRMVTRYGWNK